MLARPLPTHRRPIHPGEILEEEFRRPLNISQATLAKALGVGRDNYVRIATGKRAVTPTMALRLAHVLGTSAQMWITMQADVDLWDAQHSPEAKQIAKLAPLEAIVA
jgi:addiction module HigA family antidote